MISPILLFAVIAASLYLGLCLIHVLQYQYVQLMLTLADALKQRGTYQPVGFASIVIRRALWLPVTIAQHRMSEGDPILTKAEAVGLGVTVVLWLVIAPRYV